MLAVILTPCPFLLPSKALAASSWVLYRFAPTFLGGTYWKKKKSQIFATAAVTALAWGFLFFPIRQHQWSAKTFSSLPEASLLILSYAKVIKIYKYVSLVSFHTCRLQAWREYPLQFCRISILQMDWNTTCAPHTHKIVPVLGILTIWVWRI